MNQQTGQGCGEPRPDPDRLLAIRARLSEMGASGEFLSTYHQVLGGTCVEEGCQGCVQHTRGVAPLPVGLMCSVTYEEKLGEYRGALQQLRATMAEHRVQWDQLRREETASGFLNTGDGQRAATGDSQVGGVFLETARRQLTPGAFQAVVMKKRKELEQVGLLEHGVWVPGLV